LGSCGEEFAQSPRVCFATPYEDVFMESGGSLDWSWVIWALSMLIWESLLYTVLWASAAIATKFGLRSARPLVLASTRFTVAGLLLLGVRAMSQRQLVPSRQWWPSLIVLGILNTTLYLGASFIALSVVPAGLFNLFVAVNPLVVMILERLWLKRSQSSAKWWGLGVATVGLMVGSWQSMVRGHTPIWGIGLLFSGQIAMAVGSLYFQVAKIALSSALINLWQLLIGGALLWPIALILEGHRTILWNWDWWGSLAWLVGGVSIGAMLLWFRLLRQGASQASLWLLLTPVIGYGLGWIFLGEPVGWRGIVACLFVMAGVATANGFVRSPGTRYRKSTKA